MSGRDSDASNAIHFEHQLFPSIGFITQLTTNKQSKTFLPVPSICLSAREIPEGNSADLGSHLRQSRSTYSSKGITWSGNNDKITH